MNPGLRISAMASHVQISSEFMSCFKKQCPTFFLSRIDRNEVGNEPKRCLLKFIHKIHELIACHTRTSLSLPQSAPSTKWRLVQKNYLQILADCDRMRRQVWF